MIRLQRCADCGDAQYPPRDFCGACLSERIQWEWADVLHARVVAATLLHHANETRFVPRLPLRLGLVQFDAGPVAVCFLSAAAAPGDMVKVQVGADGLIRQTPSKDD